MSDIYHTIADAVAATLRENNCTFNAAFSAVMQNYKHLDWATTRRKVCSILGKRKKRKSCKTKIPRQLDILFGRPREEVLADAAAAEATLIAGIPEHDL